MKKIIFFLIILTFNVSAFSQSLSVNNQGWNNPNSEYNNSPSEVKIYPNPCKEEIITIEINNKEINEIKLINITGKEVLVKAYPFAENKKQVQLAEVPNGIYILKITTTDEKIVIKKLMVSKQ